MPVVVSVVAFLGLAWLQIEAGKMIRGEAPETPESERERSVRDARCGGRSADVPGGH
jgi:hypothetical protein